jgi:Zn-dependent protease
VISGKAAITPQSLPVNIELSASSIFHTRLRLHYTWLAVVVFMTAAVVTQFSTTYAILQRVFLGLLATLLFLFITLVRTYVLAVVAGRKGAPVKTVTLFAIGGVLQIDRTSTFPALDVLLAAVGMLTNLVIAGLFFAAYQVLAHTGSVMVHTVVQWLAFICLMLALFNVMPGMPLDGGRLLRGLLWKASGNYERTTRYISWAGWGIGVIFAVVGIVLLFTTRQWFVAVLLALPGLILQNAATHNRRELDPKRPRSQRTKMEPAFVP